MMKRSDSFEVLILMQACILIGISGLLGAIANLVLGIDHTSTALTAGIAIVSLVNLWMLKKLKAYKFVRGLMSVIILFIINAAWYYNFNSHGSILALFLLLAMLIIFIWPQKYALIFSAFILVNIGALYIFDLRFHKNFIQYDSEFIRISDVYFGIFIGVLMALFFSYTAKNNYLKKYEEAKKSDELKTIFLQNMSHELRTPLNAIIGFSDIIDEDSSVSQILRYNKIINSSGIHLLALVNDLMDITLIEPGETRMVQEEINLNIVLDEIFKLMEYERQYFKKDQLDLNLKIPIDNNEIIIYSDHAKLKQLLINLIKNAFKFTNVGHVVFGYNVKSDKTKPILEFFVADTGIGIKEESLDKIFDVFWQADLSQTRSHRGAGIGLSISKKLAKLLGGELRVESEVGQGSAFYFEIPYDCDKNSHFKLRNRVALF